MGSSMPARNTEEQRNGADDSTFLDSHRALAAWVREFGRLTDDVLDGVTSLVGAGLEEKPVIRRSPSRCIVQLGPVALTVTWLRGARDSVSQAELLVIVWNGGVAPRRSLHMERPDLQQSAVAPTAVWEQALVAEAASEAAWSWRSQVPGFATCTSADLARLMVDRLRTAYDEARAQQAVG